MLTFFKRGLVLAVAAALSTQPAQACWNTDEQDAAKISSFNMMLMVTALRCRTGSDSFLAEYNLFVSRNNAVLGSQNALIRQRFGRVLGAAKAEAAADQFTIGFANNFGGGHETMGCAKLKQLAQTVSLRNQSVPDLVLLASEAVGEPTLPGGICPVRIATHIPQK